VLFIDTPGALQRLSNPEMPMDQRAIGLQDCGRAVEHHLPL
jgi:hypothetical protein